MKILLCSPGADVSTIDVWSGHRSALLALGHEIIDYRLDSGIARSGAFLWYQHYGAEYEGRDTPQPTPADVLFWGGSWLLLEALRAEPDWVLIISGMFLHPDIPLLLRRAGVRVAVLFTESPYDHARELDYVQYADVAFTNERASVLGLKQLNPNVAYLPHAYDPARHHPHGKDPCTLCPDLGDVPSHDTVFVGTGFEERVALLEAVDWTGIDLGLYGQWDALSDDSPLRPFVRGGIVDNAYAAELYRRAKIGLNLYRQLEGWGGDTSRRIGGAESLNPRAYELAACGCFTVSDYRREIPEIFKDTVATFSTAEDLQAVLRYMLAASDGHRQRLAAEAMRRVNGHTFTDRATYLLDCLERYQQAEREQGARKLRVVS